VVAPRRWSSSDRAVGRDAAFAQSGEVRRALDRDSRLDPRDQEAVTRTTTRPGEVGEQKAGERYVMERGTVEGERDVVERDVVERDVVERDVVERDVVERDVVEPDVVERDVVEADAAGRDADAEAAPGQGVVNRDVAEREATPVDGPEEPGRVPTPRPGRQSPTAPDGRLSPPRRITVLGVLDAGTTQETVGNLTELARNVDVDRVAVELCIVGDPRPGLEPDLLRHGAGLHHCRAGARFAVDFARLLRRLRPEVVHVDGHGRALSALAVASAAGVPHRVLHVDGDAAGRGRLLPGRRGPTRAATEVIAASETAMRAARGADWRMDPRCRIVYRGLEPEPYGVAIAARRRGLDIARELSIDEPVSILHVSGPGPGSGREPAVAVLAALRMRGVDATLTVVGARDRDDDERVLLAAVAHGVAEYLDLAGERDDLPRLAVASSLLLVTAAYPHTLPTVVLEACAVGTPVLAVETPGIAEITRMLPGVTVLPKSAPDGVWADAALELATVVPTLDERREALRVFCRSPFTVDRWLASLAPTR
jgi:glycosyltransferase involved in cell wall biosynthesis